MEKVIENATYYELAFNNYIDRQEYCDIWWDKNGNGVAGSAKVVGNILYFTPNDNEIRSFNATIKRYSYDYGETWEDLY